MATTTYTLLVTIEHDAGAAVSTDLLETMVQRGLEEGVRDMASVEAATVSAFSGDHLYRSNIAQVRAAELHQRMHA